MIEFRPAYSHPRQRGAALVIVLMLAAVLSALAAAAMRSSASGARAAALFADVLQADELAHGTADMVARYVETGAPERRRGGSFSVRLPAADIAVDYVSESARVDANKAPLKLIEALLTAAGAEPAEVASISKRIARLRAQKALPAGGAATGPTAAPGEEASISGTPAVIVPEPEDAVSAAPASGAEIPLIQHTGEIAEAWGLSAGLAKLVLPALTVSNRSDKVDPVLAGRLVVAALLGGDPDRVDDYLRRRNQGFESIESALTLLPSQSRPFAGFSDVPTLRAVTRVTVAGRFERRYELILQPADRPGQAPGTLSWRPLI